MEKIGLVELMARAICLGDYPDPDEIVTYSEQGMEGRSTTFPRWRWYDGKARTALIALEQSGLRVVPADVTEPMLSEGANNFAEDWRERYSTIRAIWSAMLAAAPKVTP